ncbi:hypothetical protein BS78_05G040500 [Paspalum vaginatum]|nr:hypothetical protein BS78_05G040500 [Paspalum vaginatum]
MDAYGDGSGSGSGSGASPVLAAGGGEPAFPHDTTEDSYDALMDLLAASHDGVRRRSGSQPPARQAPVYLISEQLVGQRHGTGYGDVFGAGGGFGGVPASDEAVAALPATRYRGGQRGDEEQCCAVCREEYEHGDALRTMPCKHGFHETCIFPWLRVSGLCPLCRFALPAQVAAVGGD